MRRVFRTSFFALMLAIELGCASNTAGTYAEFARNDPRKRPYVIGEADVLRVTVWRDPNLSTEGAVRPDGTITVPLAGDIRATGRTAADVQRDITERLKNYVKDAVVTVAVVEVNSYRFTVAGKVEHPGLFTQPYFVTVSEAIALAGGPNRYASPDDIVVIRANGGGAPVRIPIDYERILNGERPDQDIVITAGDTVYVP